MLTVEECLEECLPSRLWLRSSTPGGMLNPEDAVLALVRGCGLIVVSVLAAVVRRRVRCGLLTIAPTQADPRASLSQHGNMFVRRKYMF